MIYKIADLCVEMTPQYSTMCAALPAYADKCCGTPQIKIELTKAFYNLAVKQLPKSLTLSDIENIYSLSQFSHALWDFNGMVLHGSAVVKDGKCYIFSGDSGAGKSTHTALWLQKYKDAYILNDDKPAVRITMPQKAPTVYGTPWCGSSHTNRNTHAPLAAVIFVSHGIQQNHIEKVTSPAKAMALFLEQTAQAKNSDKMQKKLCTLNAVISHTPIFTAQLLPNISAVTAVENALNTL